MSRVRDNERYLAFSPAVSQAFLVHSGEVRHKIVGYEKATLENKKFNILVYLRGSSVPGRRKWFVQVRVRPPFSKLYCILNYTVLNLVY